MNTQAFELLKSMLEKIDSRLDGVELEMRQQGLTLARNTTSLEEHMRRTELLEETVELFKTQLTLIQQQVAFNQTIVIKKPSLGQIGAWASAVAAIIALFSTSKQFIIDVASSLFK